MKKIFFIIIIHLIFSTSLSAASEFEELDKPPEGAHEGQMLLGGFVSIGLPYGDIIEGEEKFLNKNTYTFPESLTTKELLVVHLAYDYGLSFEYMPIDYVGVKTKLKGSTIVQRTLFGSNYKNWSETLYSNYSILLGPALHLTNRKQWDITLTPVIGYAIAEYEATPIAAELLSSTEYPVTTNRKKDASGFVYGAELNVTIYFSGGLYISLGADWNTYPVTFGSGLSLTQSNGNSFMSGKSSGTLQTINLILSAGYAFSN